MFKIFRRALGRISLKYQTYFSACPSYEKHGKFLILSVFSIRSKMHYYFNHIFLTIVSGHLLMHKESWNTYSAFKILYSNFRIDTFKFISYN